MIICDYRRVYLRYDISVIGSSLAGSFIKYFVHLFDIVFVVLFRYLTSECFYGITDFILIK